MSDMAFNTGALIAPRRFRRSRAPLSVAVVASLCWSSVLLLSLLGSVAYAQNNFGSIAVGSSSQPMTVSLTTQTTGTLDSIAAFTSGSPNLDFAVTPLTCTLNSTLMTGQSCTVSVVFSPLYPGVRQGAVVAKVGGQLLASSTLYGVGHGSLPVLVPATINTVAGDSEWIYQEDGIKATAAPIFLPSGLAVDGAGDLFLCDSSNNRVRKVDATSGLISTVAGNGSPGGVGDGGLATAAELNDPSGIAIDGAGNLFIADSGNNVVRRVDAVSGVITTFAGQMGSTGYSGDGGVATNALLASPHGLALTPGGDLVIADSDNNAVRLVTMSNGHIQTIAGTGVAGYNSDGILATEAELNDPYGVAVRSDGAIAIADLENQRVRVVSNAGVISTIAGTGQMGFSGDGGAPAEAQVAGPTDVSFDPAGDLFIADSGNNRIRLILGNNPGAIETLAGNSSEQFTGDGGPSNQATLYGPYAVLVDQQGNIWISDTFHNRVREISAGSLSTTYPTIKVGNVSAPVVGAMYNEGNANLLLNAPVLDQAALDPATTTCNQSAMTPSSTCNMGVEFAPTQVGSDILGSIHWPSNAPNVLPVNSLNGEVLSVDVTSVALTSSKNPGILGQAITLTATVSSDDTGRTGTVTFSEGSYTWCAAVTLSGSGTATCTIQSLSLGSHTLTASYSGDANNASSVSPGLVEVIKQQPALALNVSPDPATVTSSVTLTLNAVDQSGTATGAVVFYDGTTALQSVNLNDSGIAQWSTSSLAVGTHSLSAHYAGDSANMSGTSNTVSEVVNKAATTTTLASSANPATVGRSVTFTATVTSSGGPTPSGTVTFNDGSTVLGTAQLNGSGICTLTVTTLASGSNSIVASYAGNADNAASSSVALTETINKIATVTTLATTPNPVNAGAALLLTASVALGANATADGAITGSVAFRDGSTVLGTVNLNGSGQATLSVSTLSVGAHSLVATYNGDNNYASSSSSTVSETVQQTATQTTLTSAATTTLVGKPASFTAIVTIANGTPTGQVEFLDGSTVLGTTTLNGSGVATFSTTVLTKGTHSITAKYIANGNYLGSTSAAVEQTVQLAQPTLLLTGPSSAVDAGTSAQFLANLSTPGVSPTGTLSLLNGSTVVATLTVTGVGDFQFSTANLTIGSHTLTASYSGDGNNSPAVSAAITLVVKQASSQTTLVASVDPLTEGGPLTLSASVASDSPNASGQVSFYDGSTLLGKESLANSRASFSPTGLSLGTHSLTAVYTGDIDHAGSTSAPLTELVVQSTTATLSSSRNPAESGQSVTFTARISGSAQAVATGTATFRDNGALLATVTLNGSGAATFTTSSLTVGSHSIIVSYSGDGNFATAQAQLLETVTEATTAISLAASANPATYKQPVSLAATVTSQGVAATGLVTFTDSGTKIGAVQLNGSELAVLTLSTLSPGTHTLVATYAGDSTADAATSAPLTLVVKQTTTLAVTANSNPALTLNSISLTAAITNQGASTVTGSVSFTDGGVAIGTASLDADGQAILSLAKMSAGSHNIVASYPGDGSNFASTSGDYVETVQLRPTVTTMTNTSTDTNDPQQITLIAVVSGQGPLAPSGTVSFTSGSVVLGQATVGSTGVATIEASATQMSQGVVAKYSGDTNYASSQSASTTITTTPGAQFTLGATPSTITLVTHQHTTLSVTLGSVHGFADTISLGCLGLPYAATCTFTPSQIKLAADGTASSSLILDTGDPLGAGSSASASILQRGGTFLACLPFGLLVGLLRSKKSGAARRSLCVLSALLVAIALSTGASGCGGLTMSGTPPGTYTLQVVANGQITGVTETQNITLVVTQ